MCVDGVANPLITAATGWPAGATAAAFSAALLISALAGIHVGRILDHRGPRTVMTTGTLIGTASRPSWPPPQPGSVHGRLATGRARHGVHLLPARRFSRRPPPPTDGAPPHYGRLSGLLAALNTAVAALAPFAGAALAVPLGGYPALLAVLAGLSVLGAASALGSAPTGRTRTPHERVRPKA